ncbi:MAG: DNA translocase FtsK 4TM domain-containing protein [Rhodospirillales bacterium]
MIRTGTASILPVGTADLIRRRVSELGGLALLAFALLLSAVLAGFNPGDPSFNHATEATPTNLFGRPGAYTADLLLQGFGWATLVLALGPAAWGWRLLRNLPVRRPVLRALALALALPALATALSRLPEMPGVPLLAGAGGVVGAIGMRGGLALLGGAHVGGGDITMVVLIALALAGLCFAYGAGLSFADWHQMVRAPAGVIRAGRRLARRTATAWSGLADRIDDLRWRHAPPPLPTDDADDVDDADTEDGAPPRATRAPEALVESAPAARRAARTARGRGSRRGEAGSQGRLDFDPPSRHRLPPADLLRATPPLQPDAQLGRSALEQNARMLKGVLDDFSVRGEIVKVRPGPVVTLYELEPAPGIKSSRVIGLADDIARSMSAVAARVAVIPGRNVIGIELPNQRREIVGLRELLSDDSFGRSGSGSGEGAAALNLALGRDIGGTPVVVDLARMPHLLIAGTTGSGKSVAINAMILSLLYRLSPADCKFIMIDPKMLELSVYDGIPHLLAPVVTEPGKAVTALKWTVREMEERYRAMSQLGVRNVAGFNQRVDEALRKGETLVRRVQTGYDDDGQPVFEEQPLDLTRLPLIVVVVDEMADLMMVAGKDIETAVQRLSQMARAAGIHLIMATQRPSVDVITGTIKANFPTRISFQVSSKIDSRTILGEPGAEQLLGQGDMLFMAAGGRVTRIHGPFVSDSDVDAVVKFLKTQGEPEYIEAITEAEDEAAAAILEDTEGDDLYTEAVEVVRREGKVSTSFIQRRLQIGYNRAARIVERMEAEGMVSKPDRVGRREVLGSAA